MSAANTYSTVFLTQAILKERPFPDVCRSEAEILTPSEALIRVERILEDGVRDARLWPAVTGYYCGIEVDGRIVWQKIQPV